MPSLALTVPHNLGQAPAEEKLKYFLDRLKERHQDKVSNLEESWAGNTLTFGFKTFGFAVKGTMVVEADKVLVNASLPIAAMMFKGKIEQTTREELERLLR